MARLEPGDGRGEFGIVDFDGAFRGVPDDASPVPFAVPHEALGVDGDTVGEPRLALVGDEPDAAGGRRAGFGLVSMGERAAAIGGRLEIRSAPGEGTRVEVQLP